MHKISQNLQHHLMLRESNLTPGRRHSIPHWHLFHERNFYRSITPRLTVQNVQKPIGFLRKFSPNGQMLLVFTADLKSVDVYQYLGVGRATHSLCGQQDECITAADDSFASHHTRQELFNSLFTKKFNIPVVVSTSLDSKNYLDTEFSLFLENGNFVLLVSITSCCVYPGCLDNNQHEELFSSMNICEITLYLVDLRKGCVIDSLELVDDFVQHTYNLNVSLYDHTLAVLCSYSQHVELIEVNIRRGKLMRSFILGSYKDKELILNHLSVEDFISYPDHKIFFPHLEQQILAFKYRQIMKINSPNERRKLLLEFYREFAKFQELFMTQIQLVDCDHLLLQYEDFSAERSSEEAAVYVFYNLSQQKVLQVYRSDSLAIWKMLRGYCDEFRNVRSLQVPWNVSSPSNNHCIRKAFDWAVREVPGNITEATDRFNTTLPITSQSFSTSPYLDCSLFAYDHALISNCTSPKSSSTKTIEFCDPHTGILKFRVFLEQRGYNSHENHTLVSFICHPFEPFFISMQKFTSRYVMNFHLYNSTTIVRNQCGGFAPLALKASDKQKWF